VDGVAAAISAQPLSVPSASLRALPVSLAVMTVPPDERPVVHKLASLYGPSLGSAEFQEAFVKITRRSALLAATSLAVAPSANAQKAADTLRIQFIDAVPNIDIYFNSQRTGLILAHQAWTCWCIATPRPSRSALARHRMALRRGQFPRSKDPPGREVP